MKRVSLTSEAEQDLEEIHRYLVGRSVEGARSVRLQLRQAFDRLAGAPRIGHRRADLTDKPVLFWPVGSYVIVYSPVPRPIVIIRILHGARDLPSLLEN